MEMKEEGGNHESSNWTPEWLGELPRRWADYSEVENGYRGLLDQALEGWLGRRIVDAAAESRRAALSHHQEKSLHELEQRTAEEEAALVRALLQEELAFRNAARAFDAANRRLIQAYRGSLPALKSLNSDYSAQLERIKVPGYRGSATEAMPGTVSDGEGLPDLAYTEKEAREEEDEKDPNTILRRPRLEDFGIRAEDLTPTIAPRPHTPNVGRSQEEVEKSLRRPHRPTPLDGSFIADEEKKHGPVHMPLRQLDLNATEASEDSSLGPCQQQPPPPLIRPEPPGQSLSSRPKMAPELEPPTPAGLSTKERMERLAKKMSENNLGGGGGGNSEGLDDTSVMRIGGGKKSGGGGLKAFSEDEWSGLPDSVRSRLSLQRLNEGLKVFALFCKEHRPTTFTLRDIQDALATATFTKQEAKQFATALSTSSRLHQLRAPQH